MNEYLYEMIRELPDDEFNVIWKRNKVNRKNEEEEENDEILCL